MRTRRGTFRTAVPGLVVAAAVVFAVALFSTSCCGSKPALGVYSWSDYIKPELIRRFERERGCRVVLDTFESNEAMYAKLKAGATGYDLLTPSSYMVSLMHAQGMLRRLDHGLLPNIGHVDPDYLAIAADRTMDHSVPYMLVISGIAYLEGRVKDVVPSWRMFGRTDLAGRMTMFNDMRETIGAALKTLGYSINTTSPAHVVVPLHSSATASAAGDGKPFRKSTQADVSTRALNGPLVRGP